MGTRKGALEQVSCFESALYYFISAAGQRDKKIEFRTHHNQHRSATDGQCKWAFKPASAIIYKAKQMVLH